MSTETTVPSLPRVRGRIFDGTLYRIEIIRQLRNPYTLVFSLAMPVGMYLLFGGLASWGDERMAHGSVSFLVMCSMAAFGTATAMSSLCSLAASEIRLGWGRQIGMTPLSAPGYALTKLLAALTFASLSVAAVFIAGAVTGVQVDDAWRWVVAAVVILGIGSIYGLWGMGVGMLLNPDSAAALASIAITIFGFLGNAFFPLEGGMLDFARFTPLYGYVALVRWPMTDGMLTTGGQDAFWAVLLNVVIWTAIFVTLAIAGVVRSRRRA